MAIIFPRAMPDSFVAQQNFQISRVDYQSPEAGGILGGVQAGWPRWTGTWTVGNTTQEVSEAVEAWITSLRGQQGSFLARDFRRPFPLHYRRGFKRMTHVDGTAFSGSGTGWSQAIDANGNALVTLHGFPSGLVLVPIDYIGFKWDAAGSEPGAYDRRALIRITEGSKAAADGSITVTAEPALPSWVPPGALPHLDYPACVMKLTTDTQIADADMRKRMTGTKIVGGQVLKP